MPTLDLAVNAGGDDGWFYGNGSANSSANTGFTGDYDSNHERQWYRFTGVSGLSGATINSANLTLYCDPGDEYGLATVATKIAADDAAAPANPTSAADYDGRTLTTAKVDFDIQSNVATGDQVIDVTSIIQELADSYDPSVILLLHYLDATPSGGNYWVEVTHYDLSTTLCARLDIDYTPAGGGSNFPVLAHHYRRMKAA